MAEFFVRRPIVAMVIAIITVIVGLVALQSLPIAEYPEITAADGGCLRHLHGRQCGQRRAVRRHPGRAEDHGVEDMIYIALDELERWPLLAQGVVRSRHRSRHGQRADTEPRVRSTGRVARGSEAPRRDGQEEAVLSTASGLDRLTERNLRRRIPDELRDAEPDRRAFADSGRRSGRSHWRQHQRVRDAGLGATGSAGEAQPDGRRHQARDPAAERFSCPPGRLAERRRNREPNSPTP